MVDRNEEEFQKAKQALAANQKRLAAATALTTGEMYKVWKKLIIQDKASKVEV